jgi:hypothetical protein
MPRDHAYELMRGALEGVLPCLEAMARTAKNAAGRKQLLAHVEQVRQALTAAQAVSQIGTNPSPGSEAA